MLERFNRRLQQAWYEGERWLLLLWPLSRLFAFVGSCRRGYYRGGKVSQLGLSAPVIVVGNITVGGTGKSPLTIWLVERLQQAGYKPGVVSRGYGGRAPYYPYLVDQHSTTLEAGDEPWMIQRRTGVPCMVDPNRKRAAEQLLKQQGCDVIVSDDGLQHYRLPRLLEIAVIDGRRKLGNGLCLPAGPLREPAQRLASVDFVVINDGSDQTCFDQSVHHMMLKAVAIYPVADVLRKEKQAVPMVTGESVHAVAGIGNPERFFATLRGLSYQVQAHPFADHHRFTASDLNFDDDKPIIMTEKDAVKCCGLTNVKAYYLHVAAELDEALWPAIQQQLQKAGFPPPTQKKDHFND